MIAAFDAPEDLVSALIVLGPLVLGFASFFVPARRRWLVLVLAAPALLWGLAFTAAVARDGPGYGGVWLLLYGPVLIVLALAAVARWYRARP